MPQDSSQAPACPACTSGETRRTSRKGLLARAIYPLFHLFPWECTGCGENFRSKSRGRTKRRTSTSGERFGTTH